MHTTVDFLITHVLAIVNFLTTHVLGYVAAAFAGVVGWFGVHLLGKPILEVRRLRSEALRLGERYAFLRTDPYGERAIQVKSDLYDTTASLRTQGRAQSWPLRFYCWLCGYDLQEAATTLQRLAEMIGNYHVADEMRQNLLNYLYLSLGAARHLSREVKRKLRELARTHPD